MAELVPIPEVELYTDGACSPNPGLGGWAAILRYPAKGAEKEFSGGVKDTTNNRMEVMGALEGLKALKQPCKVLLVSDSKYLCDALEHGWIAKWKRNGWKTSGYKENKPAPVKNKDLWEALDLMLIRHDVTPQWVKGHNSHPMNERCDTLAVKAREALR